MTPFTLRHENALKEQRIRVSMRDRLRSRLWLTVQGYYESWRHYMDFYDDWTNLLEQTKIKLKHLSWSARQSKGIRKLLSSLTALRNELTGHGQNDAILTVPRAYSVLTLNLADSLNQTVMEQ